MGYGINIGDAQQTNNLDDIAEYGEETYESWFEVKDVELDEAPQFPFDPTGKTNYRAPSYSAWHDFCKEVGLYELFFDKTERTGLMAEHPGTFVIAEEHYETVKAARERREALGLGEPGWDFDGSWGADPANDDGVRGRDGNLARLLWLEWWFRWALDNCERPAIQNG